MLSGEVAVEFGRRWIRRSAFALGGYGETAVALDHQRRLGVWQ